MWRHTIGVLCLASATPAQTIRELPLNPQQAVDLAVSREITTLMFPSAITAVAGADMLIDRGSGTVEVEEGTPLRFHVTHAPGSNFIWLARHEVLPAWRVDLRSRRIRLMRKSHV